MIIPPLARLTVLALVLAFAWISPLHAESPLIGRAWAPREARFLSPEEVVERLAAADFVLLGEKHDNPDHHRLQAWLLRRLIDGGKRAAVGFEMIDADQAPILAAHAKTPGDAAGLGAALGWEKSAWPAWEHYAPIAQAALDGGLPILAANPPRGDVVAVARRGASALPEETARRFGLTETPPEAVRQEQETDIRESHCGQLPESMVPTMVMAQRLKDGHMAQAMIAATDGTTRARAAVLITGAMHARTDRGVPAALDRFSPGRKIVSLAFVEVEPDTTDPAAYAARYRTDVLPFDIVWFTPKINDADPCEAFANSLKNLKK